jgi:hypothetical protein
VKQGSPSSEVSQGFISLFCVPDDLSVNDHF